MSLTTRSIQKVVRRAEEPHIHEIQSGRAETFVQIFVGGYSGRVTPVPIPNTVVKPAAPMILLQRESRSLPALNKNPGHDEWSGFFFLLLPDEQVRDQIHTSVSASASCDGAAGQSEQRDS